MNSVYHALIHSPAAQKEHQCPSVYVCYYRHIARHQRSGMDGRVTVHGLHPIDIEDLLMGYPEKIIDLAGRMTEPIDLSARGDDIPMAYCNRSCGSAARRKAF